MQKTQGENVSKKKVVAKTVKVPKKVVKKVVKVDEVAGLKKEIKSWCKRVTATEKELALVAQKASDLSAENVLLREERDSAIRQLADAIKENRKKVLSVDEEFDAWA
jgi:predicted  nucleic acid-binding Zn-ribbon protein